MAAKGARSGPGGGRPVERDAQTVEVVLDHPGRVRVRVGVDDEGRRRNRLEVQGRAWADRHGIRVPSILSHDPAGAWLVSEDVTSLPQQGRGFVEAGLEIARRVAAATPMVSSESTSGWRAPARGRVLRAGQLWRAGISPAQFMRERGAAHDLPVDTAVHGDLYDSNVLLVDQHSATIIDWEHAGVGPRFSDEIRFATTLARDEDAGYAIECILGRARTSDLYSIATQLRWLSLRHYADQLTAEPLVVSRERKDAVRRRWLEAARWADEIAHARFSPRPS
ncbi:phosphotransferase [Janibacter alittae]|uniref:Phosphotransferase n=1 Tax=Janibacter alittae TaxID=3115209 RepID=A0ABZ2MGA8_9MICO